MQSISIQELHAHLNALGKNELILDVRSPDEFAEAHIQGSANVDVDQVIQQAARLATQLHRFDRVDFFRLTLVRVDRFPGVSG